MVWIPVLNDHFDQNLTKNRRNFYDFSAENGKIWQGQIVEISTFSSRQIIAISEFSKYRNFYVFEKSDQYILETFEVKLQNYKGAFKIVEISTFCDQHIREIAEPQNIEISMF